MIRPMMPQFIPVVAGTDKDGRIQTKTLQFGAVLEEDPSRPGYARLACMSKGSPLRGGYGNSYIGLGLNAAVTPVVIAAGVASAALNFRNEIQEEGWLGYLHVEGVPAAAGLFVTDLARKGDRLISGQVNAGMFRHDSVISPLFGHYIDSNTQLIIQFFNGTAAPVTISPTFSLIA